MLQSILSAAHSAVRYEYIIFNRARNTKMSRSSLRSLNILRLKRLFLTHGYISDNSVYLYYYHIIIVIIIILFICIIVIY